MRRLSSTLCKEILEFNSVYEFLDIAINSVVDIGEWDDEWIGCTPQTMKDYASGKTFHPLAAVLNECSAKAVLHSKESIFVNDVSGSCVDVSAYLSGSPECMMFTEDRDSLGAALSVILNISIDSDQSAVNVSDYRASLADILFSEAIARPVSLVICYSGSFKPRSGSADASFLVPIEIGRSCDYQGLAIAFSVEFARTVIQYLGKGLCIYPLLTNKPLLESVRATNRLSRGEKYLSNRMVIKSELLWADQARRDYANADTVES
ncbi:MAG: hypothetical protein ACRC1W_14975 [Shewanella sp.]